MIAWELLLLPFVLLGAFTRNIVVVWGLLFFLVSTFVLQLGWLPYYEYVFWAVLFWQGASLMPPAGPPSSCSTTTAATSAIAPCAFWRAPICSASCPSGR